MSACPELSGLGLSYCLAPAEFDGLPSRLEWLTVVGCETEEGPITKRTKLNLPGVRVIID
ncbi:hypothetical protein [Streptomyces nogalater]|uniref:Uncharacterized protein n=1 Tax=Streptomyces nogalater TaxID=38314 RepID=A0ABW0WSW9_STRNO